MRVRKSAKPSPLGFAQKTVSFARRNAGKVAAVVTAGATLLGASAAHAQTSATTIISNASTAVTTVEGVVGGAVGFFVIIKIVKWIRK